MAIGRTFIRTIMSTSLKPSSAPVGAAVAPAKELKKVTEGIFAINKPQWASSAGVLRDLQTAFQPSPVFAPWLTFQKRAMLSSGSRQKAVDKLKVKVGHGGTLDPLATGVLIVGVGRGTKCLGRFLECTKTYECVVLFGAATDSYDAVGKVVSRAPYAHITKELVEEKLEQFRGKIMQKPSVFSALKVDGKKMYEYARAGGEIPEVAARPVEVKELELIEFLEPGSHAFKWPSEEVDGEERVGAEKLLGIRPIDARKSRKRSRSRSVSVGKDEPVVNGESVPKKVKTDDEPVMSGALPVDQPEDVPAKSVEEEPVVARVEATEAPPAETTISEETKPAEDSTTMDIDTPAPAPIPCQAPAARLRMTVTSGFYVRSLCHDLGIACDSLGLMSELIRSRQGDYELGKNVLEYTDLEAGPEVWEPKVQGYLQDFMKQEGWAAEEVEDEESWQVKQKEREADRKEGDEQRAYQGGGNRRNYGKGNWRGKGGRN